MNFRVILKESQPSSALRVKAMIFNRVLTKMVTSAELMFAPLLLVLVKSLTFGILDQL